jgi:hypothetical protein
MLWPPNRITRKRTVVGNRFRDATTRVATSEAALNAFRRGNNLAAPEPSSAAS